MRDIELVQNIVNQASIANEIEKVYLTNDYLKSPICRVQFIQCNTAQIEVSIERYDIDNKWLGKIFVIELNKKKLINQSIANLRVSDNLSFRFKTDHELENNLVDIFRSISLLRKSHELSRIIEMGDDHSIDEEIWDQLYCVQRRIVDGSD